jgi:chemotaxis protein histidine kinase CheA
MDHGIEAPEERERKGKAPRGKIRMWTDIRTPFMNLYYNDDGNGLDLTQLEKIGKRRGLLRSHSTDQDLAELIFQSGLSTKDEVSDISGRGVGLDAVQSYLEEQGGSLHILLDSVVDREHVPFTLIMSLPLSLCFLTQNVNLETVDVAG